MKLKKYNHKINSICLIFQTLFIFEKNKQRLNVHITKESCIPLSLINVETSLHNHFVY